jgi:hypothetical protein
MARRRKNKSLNQQVRSVINKKLALGESRHKAKEEKRKECEKEGRNYDNKVYGIHSYNTLQTYRTEALKFADYIKENHKDINKLSNITKDHAKGYFDKHKDQSSHSLSTKMAAINKVYDLDLNKKELGIDSRDYTKISRSREQKAHDKKYNPDNYKGQIGVAKSFGLRRSSICSKNAETYPVGKNSFFLDKDTGDLKACVISKGGKYNEVTCLPDKKEEMLGYLREQGASVLTREGTDFSKKNEVDRAKNEYKGSYNHEDRLFDNYTKNIDNHSYRREYAQNLYDQLEEEYLKNNSDGKKYYTRKEDGRSYYRDVLLEVSRNLGHNRLNVVVQNYLT